uniref:Uncharacterized protein n=1 Tax=Kalanchoe fedtschenkoi TaxID=63787 RepID=A0A7N0T9B6_KALFE
MAELARTKEEIKRAKDSATQSWLDSRPVIDELEKLQLRLESARNRASETDKTVSQLQGELEDVYVSIRDRIEGGREAKKTISDADQASDQIKEDMKRLEEEVNESKRDRAKLKQTLRIKRQELRKLQLTLRAVRIETGALTASESEALRHVDRLETESATVQLTREDYTALMKRAKEETSLADWRISVSAEQRVLAEASREAAMKRLEECYSEQRSKDKLAEEEKPENGREMEQVLPEDGYVARSPNAAQSAGSRSTRGASSRRTNPPQAASRGQRQNARGSRRRVARKKKTSIFYRIRCFLCANSSPTVR